MNITYKDSEGKELKYFTQWDNNRVIELTGIEGDNAMIHFYNRLSSRALVVQPKKELEKYVVNVPNILLQEPCDIIVAVFVENGTEGKTAEIFSIPVEAKTKPQDYTYEENIDYINWVELNKQAKKQLEELQRLTKEIQDKYDSGAFKGDKGDRGSGIKSISKIATNGLKDTYRILFDDGKTYDYYITNGKTPVKGVDYYTIAEKEQLVNEVIEDSTNKFNTNAVEKTNTFNSNASQKLQDYNSNHNVKFKAYNDNADTKFNDYNSNATTKTNTYNTNATERLNTYNKNAETKFNTYNDNATTKFNAYNTNDKTKTTAYNNNAIEKTAEYNDNATTKLDEFNNNASSYDKRIKRNDKRIYNVENTLYDSGVAEGESLNIPDTALAEFQQVEIQINKAQNSTKGNQLIDLKLVSLNKFMDTDGTILTNPNWNSYLEKIPVLENTQYTLSREKLETGTSQFYISEYRTDDTFIKQNILWKTGTYKYTIMTTSETKYCRLGYRNDFEKTNIMFNKGDDRLEFEPYTGGIASPNPDYPQNIATIKNNFEFTSCGKNLYNGKFERGTLTNGEPRPDSNIYRSTDFIKIKENSNLIFSINNVANRIVYFFYDKDKNNLTEKTEGILSQNGKVVSLPNSCYCKIRTFKDDFELFETGAKQLEYGEQATPYEPYKAITNTVNLKGNEFLPRR